MKKLKLKNLWFRYSTETGEIVDQTLAPNTIVLHTKRPKRLAAHFKVVKCRLKILTP